MTKARTEARPKAGIIPYLLAMVLLLLTVLPVGVVTALPVTAKALQVMGEVGEEGAGTTEFQVVQEILEETAEIPYEEVRQADTTMEKGKEKVISEGSSGKKRITVAVTYENGIEKNRQIAAEEMVQPPVNRVVAYGTKEPRVSRGVLASRGADGSKPGREEAAGKGGPSIDGRKAYTMEATAYTHTGNRTASGIWPKVGVVAVDPRVIPLGTNLYIEGYGPAVAADTGGAIKGQIVDVFFDSYEECIQWGRRQVKVYILE